MKNLKKLSREAKKSITGQGTTCPPSGCYKFYLSDGQGSCIVSPCNSDYGTEVQVGGSTQCCF